MLYRYVLLLKHVTLPLQFKSEKLLLSCRALGVGDGGVKTAWIGTRGRPRSGSASRRVSPAVPWANSQRPPPRTRAGPGEPQRKLLLLSSSFRVTTKRGSVLFALARRRLRSQLPGRRPLPRRWIRTTKLHRCPEGPTGPSEPRFACQVPVPHDAT